MTLGWKGWFVGYLVGIHLRLFDWDQVHHLTSRYTTLESILLPTRALLPFQATTPLPVGENEPVRAPGKSLLHPEAS